MGEEARFPFRICNNFFVFQIPKIYFGNRVEIQAHEISKPKETHDICDGRTCFQVKARGDIKFFSPTIDYSNIEKIKI